MAKDVRYRITAIDNTQRAVASVQHGLRRVDRAAMALTRGFAALGGAVAVGMFARHLREQLTVADEMAKLTKRLGGSTEAFSELRHVADLSGISFQTMTMGLQRMTRRVAEAAGGMGEARGALRELGLDARELTKLPLDRQFEIIADRINQVGGESDKTRLAMKLFDSEGVALLQTMTNGAAGIREMRREASELGITLTAEQAAAAEEANDSLVRLQQSTSALSRTLAVELAPTITKVSDALRRMLSPTVHEEVERLTEAINNAIALGATEKSPILKNLREQLVVQLQKMSAAAERAAETGIELGGVVRTITEDGGTDLDKFREKWSTVEQKVDANLAILKEYKGELSEEEFERIASEMKKPLIEGIEEIDVTARKLPVVVKTATREMSEYSKQAARNMQDAFANFLFDPFDRGVKGMLEGFLTAIRQMIAQRAAAKLFNSLGGLFSFGAGGAGATAGAAAAGSSGIRGGGFFGGFATGGGFTVGGSGGTDSQLVSFRATPGEKVSINRPGDAGGISVVQHFDMSGHSDPELLAALPAFGERVKQETIATFIDLKRRGRIE